MRLKRKKRAVPQSNLRTRLEEYSALKEKASWTLTGIEEKKTIPSYFDYFPLFILRDMHSFLFFKIAAILLIISAVFFLSFLKLPLVHDLLERIYYVTTWKMDFVALGKEAVPVVRQLWEGHPEDGLQKTVLAPRGEFLDGEELVFLFPVEEGELEHSFGQNPQGDMVYGLFFRILEEAEILAAAPGKVVEKGRHPTYGYYLLLEHSGGMETIYGFLGEVIVELGEEVRRGQKIALAAPGEGIGKTASFYFEARERGRPFDPFSLFTRD